MSLIAQWHKAGWAETEPRGRRLDIDFFPSLESPTVAPYWQSMIRYQMDKQKRGWPKYPKAGAAWWSRQTDNSLIMSITSWILQCFTDMKIVFHSEMYLQFVYSF